MNILAKKRTLIFCLAISGILNAGLSKVYGNHVDRFQIDRDNSLNFSIILEDGQSPTFESRWLPVNLTPPIVKYRINLPQYDDEFRGLEGGGSDSQQPQTWRYRLSRPVDIAGYESLSVAVAFPDPGQTVLFQLVDKNGRRLMYKAPLTSGYHTLTFPRHQTEKWMGTQLLRHIQYFEFVAEGGALYEPFVLYVGQMILNGGISEGSSNPLLGVSSGEGDRITGLVTDSEAPTISVIELDGSRVLPNGFVPSQFSVSAQAADPVPDASGIASYNMTLLPETGPPVVIGSGVVNGLVTSLNVTGNVAAPVVDGRYQVQVQVWDNAGFSARQLTPTFNINSRLQVTQVVNGPNPFNPVVESTQIQYHLSQPADVTIYVYTIGGDRVWRRSIAAGAANGGQVGFNAVNWSGLRDGRPLANGMYVAYISARSDGRKVVKKLKMMVLK